jgi:predicted small secreted protein
MSDFAVAVVVVVAAIVVAAAVCPNTAVGKEYWIT